MVLNKRLKTTNLLLIFIIFNICIYMNTPRLVRTFATWYIIFSASNIIKSSPKMFNYCSRKYACIVGKFIIENIFGCSLCQIDSSGRHFQESHLTRIKDIYRCALIICVVDDYTQWCYNVDVLMYIMWTYSFCIQI